MNDRTDDQQDPSQKQKSLEEVLAEAYPPIGVQAALDEEVDATDDDDLEQFLENLEADPMKMTPRVLWAKLGVRFYHFHLQAFRLPTGEIIPASLAGQLPKEMRKLLVMVPGRLVATVAAKAAPPSPGPLDESYVAAAIVSPVEPSYSKAKGRQIALSRLLMGIKIIEQGAKQFRKDGTVRLPTHFVTMPTIALDGGVQDRTLLKREFEVFAKLFPAKQREAMESPTPFLDAGDLGGL